VKLIDANLLLYAVNRDSPHHARVAPWFEECLSGTETVAFAWVALLAFLRLSTRREIFPKPLPLPAAFGLVAAWLGQPCSVVLHPTERHAEILREVLEPFGAAGNLVSDAHLAALSIEHGATLCSADGDFARFAGVRWFNPVARSIAR
jgi:toxin-antitoxin system PIN domain toxin